MLYARTEDNDRATATPKATAVCPCCDSLVKAKCGKIISWHWSHLSKQDCDSFSEPMTQWHLDWQKLFPESAREVTMVDSSGTKHRADVFLREYNTIIELQHSSISSDEVQQREEYYGSVGTLVWVVDISEWADTEVSDGIAKVTVRNRPAFSGVSNIVFNYGERLLLVNEAISDKQGRVQYSFLLLDKAIFVSDPKQAIVNAKEAHTKALLMRHASSEADARELKAYYESPVGQLALRTRSKWMSTPATNKEGFSKLTYLGYYTGENAKGTYTALEFAIMDRTRKYPILMRTFCKELTDDLPLELTYVFGRPLVYRPTEVQELWAKVSKNDRGYYVLDKSSVCKPNDTQAQHRQGMITSNQLKNVYRYLLADDSEISDYPWCSDMYVGLANARLAAEEAPMPRGCKRCKVSLVKVDPDTISYLVMGNYSNIKVNDDKTLTFANEGDWSDGKTFTYLMFSYLDGTDDEGEYTEVDTWESVAVEYK